MISIGTIDRPLAAFVGFGLIALLLPLGFAADAVSVHWYNLPLSFSFLVAGLAIAIYQLLFKRDNLAIAILVLMGVIFCGGAVLSVIEKELEQGITAAGIWLFVVALGLYAWRAMEMLSSHADHNLLIKIAVPTSFGLWLIFLWQVVTTGFEIPSVLLPSPVQIGAAIAGNLDTLAADFYQTYVKSVLSGFAMGCGSGFIVAILVDRVPFLQRGLLPLGSLVSAIPIVGIAPIMVMWFGFDWQSKAAVIVVMTFFPMLVNTLAGLQATSHLEKDLMRSYAATYFQTMLFVRLPNALPFIFNALKINSTLALIGAIVAEFFGTPIVGMGFRISTEVGRMNVDVVWASIAVAAVAGSLSYGLLALLERSMTFWHPSYRGARN